MLFSARSDPLLDGQCTSLDKLGLPFPVPDASSPAWPVVVAQQELRGRNSCHLNLWCDTVLWKWVSKELYFTSTREVRVFSSSFSI